MAGETAGRTGDLYTGATSSASLTAVGKVRNWSLDATNDLIEVTNNDSSGAREYIDGITGHTCSIEAIYASTMAGSQEADILLAFSSGGSRWFDLRPTSSTTPSFRGKGFIRSFGIAGQTEDADILNVEIQYSGAVEFST